MMLASLQSYVPSATTGSDTSLLPYMLVGALLVGAGLLLLGFLAFRWKRPEAIGFPGAQVSPNDGTVDLEATADAIRTQEEAIGHIPKVGRVSGQDHIDSPRPSPIAVSSVTHR